MDVGFYAELFLNMGKNQRKAILVWRIRAVFSIFDFIISIYLQRLLPNGIFLLLGPLEIFIHIPFFYQVSVCNNCGRRIHYRPLISNKCSRCGKEL
mgnify:FL=1